MEPTSKRVIDVALALLCIVVLSPVMILISLMIKFIDRRCPIVVGIPALGRGGKPFRMYKFSSMVRDADKMLADLLESDSGLREEWERDVKLAKDPRLLPVIGKPLRQYSLNELPQLFNVLKGDMSLVGPRPISRAEEQKYIEFGGEELLAQRHSIRPGITGLWQVSGRSDISYTERIQIDATYLRERSLLLDLTILWKTAVIVLLGRGAY